MSIPAPPLRNANDVLAKQLMDCAMLVKKGEQGPLLQKTLRDLAKYIGGAPGSVDGSSGGSVGSRSVASEGNSKGARNKLSNFGKKIVGTLKHSNAADEQSGKPPPVVGRVVHGSADKANWLGGHEHEGDWCEEHFCQGCACKQRTAVPAQPVVSPNVTRVRLKPAFHRPTNPNSAMVANGWVEQARRSKMRTVWKEVLASIVEGRKPGEETTLWIQREVITDGKTTLEALHQLPIRWMQDVTFLGDVENRFSIKVYHLPDEFVFRCPDEDAAQNWVLTLRSMKEISQRQASTSPPNGIHDNRTFDEENKRAETVRPPLDNQQRHASSVPQHPPQNPSPSDPPQQETPLPPQEKPPRMTVKELRAIAHGAGISTIGMERGELEAIVFKIANGQTVAERNTDSAGPAKNQRAEETSPDQDTSDRARSPGPIERSPSDEDREDYVEKEKAKQRQFELEEAAKRRALREKAERQKAREEEERMRAEKEEEARQKEEQEKLERSIAERVKRQQEQERHRKEEEERKAMEAERLKREEEDHKRRVAELHAAEMRKKQEEAARLQQEHYKQQQEAWKQQQAAEAERVRLAQQQQAEEARRQHEAFLRHQQAQQQQQQHYPQPQWQQSHPGQQPHHGQHPQWQHQHPQAGQHPHWQQQNGYPPNQHIPPQGQNRQGQAPPPQSSSPFSSKYANMAKQQETGSIEKIKHGVLVEWALQPPQFQILRPIEELLISIHGVLPPRFGVPAHEYFSKWTPIKREDLSLGPTMGNRTDSEKLNKIVRKQLRFFLHPDKLPKDLSEGQIFLCKLLWDICNDAWEEHKKREEELGWMRS